MNTAPWQHSHRARKTFAGACGSAELLQRLQGGSRDVEMFSLPWNIAISAARVLLQGAVQSWSRVMFLLPSRWCSLIKNLRKKNAWIAISLSSGQRFLIAFTEGHIASDWELEHHSAGNSLKWWDESQVHDGICIFSITWCTLRYCTLSYFAH